MSALLIVVFLHLGYDGQVVVKEIDLPSISRCEEAKLQIIKELGGQYNKVNFIGIKATCVRK